jgi:hypothetical protein
MKKRTGDRSFLSTSNRRVFSRGILISSIFLASAATVGALVHLGARDACSVGARNIAEAVSTAPASAAAIPFGVLVGDLRSHGGSPAVAEAPPAAEPAEEAALETPEPEAPKPPRRPDELAAAEHAALRHDAEKKTALSPAPADNRTLFEKFFGALQPTTSALAYAPSDTRVAPDEPLRNDPNPARRFEEGTAVYDISAHTVYLPDGSKLEAHSGLRDKLDDPRFVHVRMHGATPPHTYELAFRESLFHGVRAIRLKPVGGEGAIFGRAGLLAHTYMLGPRGDSNGCVSFKNYAAFLRAFEKGDVKRLVVVSRLD